MGLGGMMGAAALQQVQLTNKAEVKWKPATIIIALLLASSAMAAGRQASAAKLRRRLDQAQSNRARQNRLPRISPHVSRLFNTTLKTADPHRLFAVRVRSPRSGGRAGLDRLGALRPHRATMERPPQSDANWDARLSSTGCFARMIEQRFAVKSAKRAASRVDVLHLLICAEATERQALVCVTVPKRARQR
jgi:hypothetical protein